MSVARLLHAAILGALLMACGLGTMPDGPTVREAEPVWVDLTDDHVAWLTVWVDDARNWYECQAQFRASTMLVRCTDGYQVEV